MLRKVALYLVLVGACGAGVAWVMHLGAGESLMHLATSASSDGVPALAHAADPRSASSSLEALAEQLAGRLHEPLAQLLLQVIVVVTAARLAGALFRRLGQPAVTGEMVAGIVLGPSVAGALWPSTQPFLFPVESMGALRLLSQIGVILYMFVVGIELDLAHLRRRADAALLVSHVSILAPFLLGSTLALALYPTLAPAGVSFSSFTLFLGVAMSITAFPVLARILDERQLSRTRLGAIAITCAAVDDVTAWCLLAVVVAVVKAEALTGAAVTVVLAAAFVALLWLGVRPILGRRIGDQVGDESRQRALIGLALTFVFSCALATELIGIHALFGAFLAGVAMPEHAAVREFLQRRLEAFSTVVLLPLFFAFTGLRTHIGLLDDGVAWATCAAVIAVAVAGKLGGGMLAARVTGMSWRDSFALGALMNTRGLIELIVLNIGYDLGIISGRIFAMLVLMAVVTTLMTGPLLRLSGTWRQVGIGASETG